MDPTMIPALIFQDAALLIRQYRNRNNGDLALNREQRKAWASEATSVLEALIRLMEPAALAQAKCRSIDVTVEWNRQIDAGERIATTKVTPEMAASYAKVKGKPLRPAGGPSVYTRNLQERMASDRDSGTAK